MFLSLNARQAKISGLIVLTLSGVGCGGQKSSSSVSDDATFYEGSVSTCADGDTCNVKLDDDGSTLKVRLIGIDAPESRGGDDGRGQPLGQEAKAHINTLIKGKHVKVRVISLDRYERSLGEVFYGNMLVNVEMLKQGLAESYIWSDDVINAPRYESAEAKAQSAHKGIWSLEDYERPEDFRRRMREETEQ
jgi:micrococcal nuclease